MKIPIMIYYKYTFYKTRYVVFQKLKKQISTLSWWHFVRLIYIKHLPKVYRQNSFDLRDSLGIILIFVLKNVFKRAVLLPDERMYDIIYLGNYRWAGFRLFIWASSSEVEIRTLRTLPTWYAALRYQWR